MGAKVRLKIDIPFRDGITLPTYFWDYMFVPKMGRNMTFYEFVLNPETSKDAAHLISQEVKKQTKLSPGRIVQGFMDQMYQGATLGWSEEMGSYFAGIPAYLKGGIESGAEDYGQAVEDYRKKQRARNEMFQFIKPETSAFAQGTGLAIPIAASLMEPTPAGEAAVGAYSLGRTATRAFNPFAIAGTTTSATFAESILKAMVLSGAHSAGAAEGYWKDRLSSVPEAMREGMEWGVLANAALFGTMATFSGLMRIPWAKHKLQSIDFMKRLGKDFEERIRKADGDESFDPKFNQRSLEVLAVQLGLDTRKMLRGGATHEEIVTHVDDLLKDVRARAAVESELTLGELGGPHWKAQQLQSLVDDPASALAVREQIAAREAGDPARVSEALRENQPTTLQPSATDALNLRQSRLTGRETDPISGETYAVERPGLLSGRFLMGDESHIVPNPLPNKPGGGSMGVTDIYYQRGYTANEIPLKGNLMETFSDWKGWPGIYKDAQQLRNDSIGGGSSPRHLPNGLSNELPAWQEFLGGVRYIPKSTAKEHGRTVKQQLNPKDGQWQTYKKTPYKGWKTRTRVVFDDFKVIVRQQNPKTLEWSDVPVGKKPFKGWKTEQKTVGTNWAVRLNDKTVSFEALHDMRQALDDELALLKDRKPKRWARVNQFRTQLDNVIKQNPDMAKADNYFSAFKKMEAAAASGGAAWTKSLPDLVKHYNRMSVEEKRMFRTAMVQTVERKGFTSTQLTDPRISGEIAEVPGKIRMLFPEGAEGTAMYNQAMEELGMSARMQQTADAIGTGRSHPLVKREPAGIMKTLSLLAKLPAYSFSMEFALGRDLIEKARKVDASVNTGVARNLNRILATKSGPEASAMIDELASTAVRMQGNIPAANSLRAFADTLRSVGTYIKAGTEVDKMPPIQGSMTGIPEGQVDIPPGTFSSLLEGYEPRIQNEVTGEWEPSGEHPYDRNYPATEVGSSLLEDYGVPVADYLREKVPYWWYGPR